MGSKAGCYCGGVCPSCAAAGEAVDTSRAARLARLCEPCRVILERPAIGEGVD